MTLVAARVALRNGPSHGRSWEDLTSRGFEAMDAAERVAELVLADRIHSARGEFATLQSVPVRMALPHGNALLIPGFTGSKEDFDAVLPLLADVGWAVATYDQRGQFESRGGADDDYTLNGFAADAAAVADAIFGTSEQVHLVGHSFGGLVATAAVVADPSHWASLTLLCSGPGALPPGPRRDEVLALDDAIRREGLEAAYQLTRARDARLHVPEPPPDVEAFAHRRFLSNDPESLASIASLLAAAPDRTAELAMLDLPVTVIRAESDDAWPTSSIEAMARTLGTHVEVIKDAAHSPAAEQPERTRDALARAFLR